MSKGKILVVDDEIYIVHILDFALSMEGYEVVRAISGKRALNQAREELPDLIVLDTTLPVMDGYEVCKALKADETTRNIPVIMLAQGVSLSTQARMSEVGAADYLTKPFSPRGLLERINILLASRPR